MDRLAVLDAYWMYMNLWNRGGLTERDRTLARAGHRSISTQLSALGYRPPLNLRDETDLELTARDIYDALVETYEGGAA